MDKHIDMNPEIQRILVSRAQDVVYRAIVEGNPNAMLQLQHDNQAVVGKVLAKARRERKDPGPAQVQSFLRFVVDRATERQMEDAEADNVVYDALGEHRILGKKRKQKGI
jgi:hypothetical protein